MPKIVEDLSQRIVLPPKTKRGVQRAVERVLKPTFFSAIPLQDIFDAIKSVGVDVIDESGDEWSGFVTGDDGRADFDLAYAGKKAKSIALHLTWHKMPSGRYEVIGYVM